MSHAREFEAVLRETQSVVRAYIAGMGVALDRVDDLAQETYLEYYKGMERRPSGTEPIQWLKGIARNLCLNHFRKSKRAAERHLEAVAVLLERTPSAVERGGAPERLGDCLERLEGRSRELVELRYEASLPSDAIGAKLGMTSLAVRTALVRIRTALRDCLERGAAEGAAS